MNENDPKLRELLKQWRDIDPPGSFDQDVWRRIRVARTESPARAGWRQWLHSLVGQPTFAMATAIVVAMLIGGWAGLQSRAPYPSGPADTFGFLGGNTLAGSYAQLTGGAH